MTFVQYDVTGAEPARRGLFHRSKMPKPLACRGRTKDSFRFLGGVGCSAHKDRSVGRVSLIPADGTKEKKPKRRRDMVMTSLKLKVEQKTTTLVMVVAQEEGDGEKKKEHN